MNKANLPLLARALREKANPAILPVPEVSYGNNKPKSLHKTRRTWEPNTRRMDLPAPLLMQALSRESVAESSAMGAAAAALAGAQSTAALGAPKPVLRGVKFQMRRIRDVEKAGGVEGLLVSLYDLRQPQGFVFVQERSLSQQLSRPGKHLTPFGRRLRGALFDELHHIRRTQQTGKLASSSSPSTSASSTPSSA